MHGRMTLDMLAAMRRIACERDELGARGGAGA